MAQSEQATRPSRGSSESRWNLAELLSNARRLAAVAEPFPFNLVRCVRGVLNAKDTYSADPAEFKRVAAGPVACAMHDSPSLCCAFYFAVERLNPTGLADSPPRSLTQLASMLEPEETIAVLTTSYLIRRLERRSQSEEWARMEQWLYRDVELACLVAPSLDVPRGRAVLFSAIRHIAFGCFLLRDPKGFSDYKRLLRKGNWGGIAKEEVRRFGCTHSQLASVLMIDMGFGVGNAELMHRLYGEKRPSERDGQLIVQLLTAVDNLRSEGRLGATDIPEDEAKEIESAAEKILTEREMEQWLTHRLTDLSDTMRAEIGIPDPPPPKNKPKEDSATDAPPNEPRDDAPGE